MPKIVFALFMFGLAGCAYRFGYEQRDLPGGYKQVAIPVFKNVTPEVGIESYFTNELARQFHRSQVARVIEKSQAPVTIEGIVRSITYRQTSTIEGNKGSDNKIEIPKNSVLAVEYRVIVTADVFLKRNSDQKVLWEGSFSNESVYAAPQVGFTIVNSVNPLYNQSARMELFETIARDMMAEAHDRMTENF
jgi:hypothetical protein